MTFNSVIFLLYAAVFFACWPLARRHSRTRYIYITILSLFFYGWWDWRFVPLLVATGLLDFWAAILITDHPRYRRFFLAASLISNIGVLAFFKYANFFLLSINDMAGWFGSTQASPMLSIVLPLGISFYTFASMSYTIDVYRGECKATRDPWHFMAFLSLFCHLVAGPILRAAALLPQMARVHQPSERERYDGLSLVVTGFFKKVVIADNLALTVDTAFSGHLAGGSLFWWIAITMFAFQIYCDFSGYSDIARGLAKWMGYDFMLNFDHPYRAASLREFWARWHISLSTWFRDYVYIPLGGTGRSRLAGLKNMWITMLLSGLWHGANWTFIFWGGLHALYLTVERLTRWPERLQAGGRITQGMAWLITLVLVWVSWVFFRANSLTEALHIVVTMFSFVPGSVPISLAAMAFLALGIGFEAVLCLNPGKWLTRPQSERWWQPVTMAVLIAATIFLRGTGNTFIYFNF